MIGLTKSMHAPQDQGSTSTWSPFLLPQWATQDLGRHSKVTLQEVLMINADCKKCNKFSSIPSLYQWAVSRTFLQQSPSRLYSNEKFASSKNQPVIRCNGPFPWRLMMRNQEVAWGGEWWGGGIYVGTKLLHGSALLFLWYTEEVAAKHNNWQLLWRVKSVHGIICQGRTSVELCPSS